MSKARQQHFIEGENIYLREVRESDVNEAYYTWMNDNEVTQFLESRFYPNSTSSITEFIRKNDSDPSTIFLALINRSDEVHVGNIKLGPINWIHRFAEVGILMGEKSYWGKGIATEALKLVSFYAFNKLNLRKLTAGCYSNNKGSEKAFLKAGFSIEGTRKSHFFYNGEYVDYTLLGLINTEFQA